MRKKIKFFELLKIIFVDELVLQNRNLILDICDEFSQVSVIEKPILILTTKLHIGIQNEDKKKKKTEFIDIHENLDILNSHSHFCLLLVFRYNLTYHKTFDSNSSFVHLDISNIPDWYSLFVVEYRI